MPKKTHHVFMKDAVAENETKRCKLKHCTQFRFRLTDLCNHHYRMRHCWGSPYGRCWRVHEVDTCKAAAKAFLDKNVDSHPGLKFAIEWLQAEMDGAELAIKKSDGLPAFHLPYLVRMRRYGVTPHDILLVVIKLVFYLMSLPTSQRDFDVFTANLGYHLARLARKLLDGRPISKVQPHMNAEATRNRALGAYMFGSLRPLILHLVVHVQEAQQARASHMKKLDVPFEHDPT